MKAVEVIWHDVYELAGDWMDFKELEQSLAKRDNKGAICRTRGSLIREDSKILVIGQTDQPEEENPEVSNLIIIPKEYVVEVIELVRKD